VTITGSADILSHRWDCESVEEKSTAPKGSKGEKTDNVESHLYRDADGVIGFNTARLRAAVIEAGRYRQDPRSSRKSISDLLKAAIATVELLVPFARHHREAGQGIRVHFKTRAVVQRSTITWSLPAFHAGWSARVPLLVLLPEYISASVLNELVASARRLCGIGDFRPTYAAFRSPGSRPVKIDAPCLAGLCHFLFGCDMKCSATF
jgi:hypothetical protein